MERDALIDTLKGDLRDELGAVAQYSVQIPFIERPEMRRKLEEIRDEEQTHAREFAGMLDELGVPYQEEAIRSHIERINGEVGRFDGSYQEGQAEEAEVKEDYSEVAHWINGLSGSPGIVSDPGRARSQPCIRYELGQGYAPLIFQKGIIGALDEDQVAEFCALGFEDKEPTERQKQRFRALPTAAHLCSLEAKEVPPERHLDTYYSCLERELRDRGVH